MGGAVQRAAIILVPDALPVGVNARGRAVAVSTHHNGGIFAAAAGQVQVLPRKHTAASQPYSVSGLQSQAINSTQAGKSSGLAQAVQTSSLDNIIGEGPRRLAEQHDHERGRDGGQNKRRPAVNKAPVGHHLEQRDHDGYERQHHGQQQHAHQGVLGLVVVDLKAVTGDGADQQRDEGHQDSVAEGVCHGQP